MGAFDRYALIPEQGALPQMQQLDEDTRMQIRTLAARLETADPAAVAGFGSRAQKEMGAFTEMALSQMLREDAEPLEGVMQTLAEQIRLCSAADTARDWLHRLFGGADDLAQVRSRYERAQPRIRACADEMTDRRVALMRDSAVMDRIYTRNETLYRELCSLIVIGEEALRQARERGAEQAEIARLERRIQDLRLTHTASTQLAAQVMMLKSGNELACTRLQTALEVTIPLWKSQMAAALGMARVNDSLRMQRARTGEAERGIRAGTAQLHAQSRAAEEKIRREDREKAGQTAERLLRELEEIETSLKEQKRIRKQAACDGR